MPQVPLKPSAPQRRAFVVTAGVAAIALVASASPSRAASINSVQTMIEDMTRLNDAKLIGAPPTTDWSKGPGKNVMGGDPRGSATPDWWQPADKTLKADTWWKAFIPWFVVYIGEGDAATNTRVELRNLVVHWQSRRTGRWHLLGRSIELAGEDYPTHLIGSRVGKADLRKEVRGVLSVKPQRGWAFHGWWTNGKLPIQAEDVANWAVSLQARLAVDDPRAPDDRARARYLVSVGADYYPSTKTTLRDFAPTGYNPGVGYGRYKLVGPDWQAFNYVSMPIAELRRNPPPLE